jgi:DUF4097 and DUF4098 domain-containing protein YvlB
MYEFSTTGPIMAVVHVRSGGVAITAEEREGAVVEVTPYDGSEASREAAANTIVDLRGDTLVIEAPDSGGRFWRRGGSVRVIARVPIDSRLELTLASADTAVNGRWQEASIQTASGDITAEEIVGDLNANTASGGIRVGRVGGAVRGRSASADLWIGAVGGDCSLHSASGDIHVEDCGRSVEVRTASGDIDLRRTRRGDVRVQTASGDVTIGVEPGTRVYFDVSTVSGSTHNGLDAADPSGGMAADLSVSARTVSGDVAVVRAAQKMAA